jgi:serine/threonine protein kinase
MLIKNPEERPSARDCLKHPWLHEYLDSDDNTRRF